VSCGTIHAVVQPASRGPGRPPAAKAAETRKRILRAAREVFSERGYDAATFQAIAIRADLTRPAINHYFANKRVLYWQVLDETNSAMVAASVQRARGETTLTGQVAAFIEGAIDAEIENRTAAARLFLRHAGQLVLLHLPLKMETELIIQLRFFSTMAKQGTQAKRQRPQGRIQIVPHGRTSHTLKNLCDRGRQLAPALGLRFQLLPPHARQLVVLSAPVVF